MSSVSISCHTNPVVFLVCNYCPTALEQCSVILTFLSDVHVLCNFLSMRGPSFKGIALFLPRIHLIIHFFAGYSLLFSSIMSK